MRVWSSKMRVFSFARYIFRMKFTTGFTCRNLHGFVRFSGDSTALVTCSVHLDSPVFSQLCFMFLLGTPAVGTHQYLC